jgi:5-methylcytosine-specific restriction endonuclease McrA
MRDFAKSFYKSKRWQKCRDAFMESKHYICERCGRPAVIAHHRKYITPENINDPNIALSWDNLECLCNACHEAEHRGKLPVISEGLKFDKRGNVVKKQ